MRTRDGGTRDGASTTGRPGRLQWTDTALVEAPAERVWELLISTIGDTAVDDRHVRIDRSARRLVVEGDWWFRGVYSVEPHERGTLVVCRVYDIARTARLLVPVNNLFNRTRQTTGPSSRPAPGPGRSGASRATRGSPSRPARSVGACWARRWHASPAGSRAPAHRRSRAGSGRSSIASSTATCRSRTR